MPLSLQAPSYQFKYLNLSIKLTHSLVRNLIMHKKKKEKKKFYS